MKRKRKWGQDEKGWGEKGERMRREEKGERMQRERIGGIGSPPRVVTVS